MTTEHDQILFFVKHFHLFTGDAFPRIFRSIRIPHTLFAAHPRLSEAEREKITPALISWGNSNEGKEILKDKWLMPFRRISDTDYDIVREIKTEVDSYL